MRPSFRAPLAALVASLVLVPALRAVAADAPATQPAAPAAPASKPGLRAVALLQPVAGSGVTGTVTFSQVAGGVEVKAELSGLAPGKHGFHIHEYGDCSAPDASSAGGHFNPEGHPHAGLDTARRHAGDLGNLDAAADGKAALRFIAAGLAFAGDASILGRGVIVHVNADDFTTQPTGNAGGRVACGAIGLAK